MSDLVIVRYPDQHAAFQAAEAVARLVGDDSPAVEAMAVATRDHAMRLRLTASRPAAAVGAGWGALLGALAGLLVVNPLPAVVLGTALGAITTEVAKAGVEANVRRWVGKLVGPGGSLVVIVVRHRLPRGALAALTARGGALLPTSSVRTREQRVDHHDIESDHDS